MDFGKFSQCRGVWFNYESPLGKVGDTQFEEKGLSRGVGRVAQDESVELRLLCQGDGAQDFLVAGHKGLRVETEVLARADQVDEA